MSGEAPAWIVFDCPACGRPVKMPEAARGHRMACPVCSELISPPGINDDLPEHFSRTLPGERHLAPPPSLRSEARENWEPAHPEKKPPVFESMVGRIGEDVALATPEELAEREKRRARIQRRHHAVAAPSWESEEAPLRLKKRRRHHRRTLLLWGASAALFLGAATAAAVLFGRREPPPRAPRPAAVEPPVSAGVIASSEEGSFSTVSEADYAELVRVIRRFVAAATVEEALPLVRDQGRVARLLNDYWRDHSSPERRLLSVSPRVELVSFNGMFCGFVELGDYSKRIFAMEKTPEGGFLLDWESYTGWCEVPWELLPTERPTRPVLLRAQLKSDDYFNRGFSDPAKYACFRLQSLDHSHKLYGYVPIHSPLFAELESKTKFSPLVLCIIKIRYPEGETTGDQVEITDWLCDGWVLRTGTGGE